MGPVISAQEPRARARATSTRRSSRAPSCCSTGATSWCRATRAATSSGRPCSTTCTPDMTHAQEEIFGPVASLMRVNDLDEAIKVTNASPFGNAASIYTTSGRNARKFWYEVQAGNIGVNLGIAAAMAYFPFAGQKDSFFGTHARPGQRRGAVLHRQQGRHHPLVAGDGERGAKRGATVPARSSPTARPFALPSRPRRPPPTSPRRPPPRRPTSAGTPGSKSSPAATPDASKAHGGPPRGERDDPRAHPRARRRRLPGRARPDPATTWPAVVTQLIAAERDAARYHDDFVRRCEDVLAASSRAFTKAAGQDRTAADELSELLAA